MEMAYTRPEITSKRILTKVGGVLFSRSAISGDQFSYSDLSLKDIEYENGQATISFYHRKWYWLRSNIIYYRMPEWALVPTLNYSRSRHNAAATLFGRITDSDLMSALSLEDERIIRQYKRIRNRYDNFVKKNGVPHDLSDSESVIDFLNFSKRNRFESEFKLLSKNLLDGSKYTNYVSLNQYITNKSYYDRQFIAIRDRAVEKLTRHYYLADLHPDLSETKVGFRLLQADTILSARSFLNSLKDIDKEILFSGDVKTLDADGTPTNAQANAMSEIDLLFFLCKKQHPELVYRAWILTDFDVEYRVLVNSEGEMEISGSPFFYIWGYPKNDISKPERKPTELKKCTNIFRHRDDLYRSLNVNVWGLTLTVARFSSFLRSLKAENKALLEEIIELSEVRSSSFFTPRRWPRDGNF